MVNARNDGHDRRPRPSAAALAVGCALVVGCAPDVSSIDDADSGPGAASLADAGADGSRPAEVDGGGAPDAGPAGRQDAGPRDATPDDAGANGMEPDDAALADGGSGDADAGGVISPPDGGPVQDDAGPTALRPCPTYASGAVTGFVLHLSVREASGVVESRRNPGVLWLHNDSGGNPELFAVSTSGRALGTFVLDGAGTRDWEDIAVGPGPQADTSYLYVADIGDNGTSRANVQVYRVAEPVVADGTLPAFERLSGVETFVLAYPDGAHNAETFLVDPLSGDAYIVVKAGSGQSPVFRARAPLTAGTTLVMEPVTSLHFGAPPLAGDTTTTGGDISPSGDAIAIRTYDSAYLWRRPAGMSIDEALAGAPCAIPLRDETQGEALGFAADGAGYYTVSEGGFQRLWFFALE